MCVIGVVVAFINEWNLENPRSISMLPQFYYNSHNSIDGPNFLETIGLRFCMHVSAVEKGRKYVPNSPSCRLVR